MKATAKICGLTTADTLDAAIAGGASHIGFVFFPRSPRNITPAQAGALARRAAGRAQIAGLFVDPEPAFVDAVREQVRLDVVQLHGDERPALVGRLGMTNGLPIWKAIPVRTRGDLDKGRKFVGSASRLLYDAKPPPGLDLPGGNGLRFDWTLLENFKHPLPWVLSGGLDPRNVADAISRTSAQIVDVSSGVETAPGVKDARLIEAFLKAVSSA